MPAKICPSAVFLSMRRLKPHLATCCCFALIWALEAAEASGTFPLEVEGESFSSAVSGRPIGSPKSARLPSDPFVISLDPPSDTEAQALDADGDKRTPIGFGRPLPLEYAESLDLTLLNWQSLADGGRVAVIEVHSPGAAALRLQVDLQILPAGVELRFFDPTRPSSGPTESYGQADGAPSALRWSPSVVGDRIALEILVPAAVSLDAIHLALPRVSHWLVSPSDAASLRSDLAKSDAKSARCPEVDIACDRNDVPQYVIDSVALYAFSTLGGASYICNGQLLNDTDTSTQIPHFLTSRHCISTPAEAQSMEFYWFFQRTRCGGTTASLTHQTGGAALVAGDPVTDHALLRLNDTPPIGVGLAGWTTTQAQAGDLVLGIHHPGGDLKKISRGNVLGLYSFSPLCERCIGVRWFSGVTEPGSSGSGLWATRSGGEPLLVGVLSGGIYGCAASDGYPSGEDYYGRFDQFFPLVAGILDNAASLSTTSLANISTNGPVDGRGMLAGFIVTGAGRFAILSESAAPAPIADTGLTLYRYDYGTQIFSQMLQNDNWNTAETAQYQAIIGRTPGRSSDAGILIDLDAGIYLAQITDRNGQTGTGMISVTEGR